MLGINDQKKDPTFDEIWKKIENKLESIFKKAAEICLNKNLINRVQYDRYFVSSKDFESILDGKNKKTPTNTINLNY
jgi:hypothetical protein